MTTELKPCPFCGESAIAQHHKEDNWFSYGCSSEEGKKLCCAIMPMTHIYNSEKEAAEAWNTRATPSPAPELVTVAKTDADELRMCASGFATSIWMNSIDGELPEIELVTRDQAERIIGDLAAEAELNLMRAEKTEAELVDQVKENERLKDENRATFNTYLDTHNKVTTLEAKLANIEKQEAETKVKQLEWANGQARSALGDLYDVFGLSENVWITRKNATEFHGWVATRELAMQRAQTAFNNQITPCIFSHPVADREAETIERLKSALDRAEYGFERIHKSLMNNGPKQASGEVTAFFLSEIRALSGKEPAASPLAPEGVISAA